MCLQKLPRSCVLFSGKFFDLSRRCSFSLFLLCSRLLCFFPVLSSSLFCVFSILFYCSCSLPFFSSIAASFISFIFPKHELHPDVRFLIYGVDQGQPEIWIFDKCFLSVHLCLLTALDLGQSKLTSDAPITASPRPPSRLSVQIDHFIYAEIPFT